jgi:hypothetical protein
MWSLGFGFYRSNSLGRCRTLTEGLASELDRLKFTIVAIVAWMWSSLSRPIKIWWLRSDKYYSSVNLLQYHEQCLGFGFYRSNSLWCRPALTEGLASELNLLKFITVAIVAWIWFSLNRLIKIWWLRSNECYNIMNLLHHFVTVLWTENYHRALYLDGSQPHDQERTLYIICYSTLFLVTGATTEYPDASSSY